MKLPEVDVLLADWGVAFGAALMSALLIFLAHLASTPQAASEGSAMETVVALLIGFVGGYGVRGLISRRRRAEYRSRHPKRYSEHTMEND